MRSNTFLTGVAIPGLVAGVIYVVISLATGSTVAASLTVGSLVAIVAILIGAAIRAVFVRRAASG